MTPSHEARPKQVLSVDDHPIVCLGIDQLLQRTPDFRVCGQCDTAAKALVYLEQHHVDIVIVDLSLKDQPQGLDLIKEIRQRYPSVLILVLSMLSEHTQAEPALRAGANGYVMKEEVADRLLVALTHICKGHIYVSDAMQDLLLQPLSSTNHEKIAPTFGQLSEREVTVFRLIAQGYSIKQIAQTLRISDKTADVHRTNIRRKLHLPNSLALYHTAFQWWNRNKVPGDGNHE